MNIKGKKPKDSQTQTTWWLWWLSDGRGVDGNNRYMVMGDLTLCDGHTIQSEVNVLQKSTLGNYIIVLTEVTQKFYKNKF